jgi:hypothetical protein
MQHAETKLWRKGGKRQQQMEVDNANARYLIIGPKNAGKDISHISAYFNLEHMEEQNNEGGREDAKNNSFCKRRPKKKAARWQFFKILSLFFFQTPHTTGPYSPNNLNSMRRTS